MKISEKAISEHLQEWISEVNLSQKEDFDFTGIQIVTEKTTGFRPDILYVCTSCVPGAVFDCADSCFLIQQNSCEATRTPPNAIVLRADCNLLEIISGLLYLFESANSFMEALQQQVITGNGFNSIFHLVARQFPDCLIVMTDTAYNIIHSTMGKVDDRYLQELLDRGYYNKNDVDMLAKHGYFDDWQRTVRPRRYSPNETVSGKDLFLRSYQNRGLLLGFVACYFITRSPSEFDYLLFKGLTDCIERLIIAESERRAYAMPDEQLVADILRPDNEENESLSRDRCERLRLPYKCNFRIGVIQSESGKESIAAGMTKSLLIYCPVKTYGIYKFRTDVIIVFHDWDYSTIRDASFLDEKMHLLAATLKASRCRMGISLGFDNMSQFRLAYIQAKRAIMSSDTFWSAEDTQLRFYSDWYLQDMLSSYGKIIPLDTVYTRQLDALTEGKHNEYDNLSVLYVYLRTERNITATAKILDMHRNGAAYRVRRIDELLGLDLDDADVRLRILISFEILKKLGLFCPDKRITDAQNSVFHTKKD